MQKDFSLDDVSVMVSALRSLADFYEDEKKAAELKEDRKEFNDVMKNCRSLAKRFESHSPQYSFGEMQNTYAALSLYRELIESALTRPDAPRNELLDEKKDVNAAMRKLKSLFPEIEPLQDFHLYESEA